MRPIILTTLVLPLLASCGQVDSTPEPLTEKQTALLAKETRRQNPRQAG